MLYPSPAPQQLSNLWLAWGYHCPEPISFKVLRMAALDQHCQGLWTKPDDSHEPNQSSCRLTAVDVDRFGVDRRILEHVSTHMQVQK